ncbi:MAG: type II secretion system F family protein [Nitrospirota bacterium]|nr:type II secretion system F family protein [Nitrospirota bacterium]MDH5699195.1 type II secretion system F family protein [Nitrospirota bacterium]
MPRFEYRAKDGAGQTVQGEVLAATSVEALQLLRGQDVLVTCLQEKVERVFNLSDQLTGWSRQWNLRGVSSKELVVFTHQLATLIRAGVPLLECLDILSSEGENPTLQQVVKRIRADVEGGTFLADALKRYPTVFHEFYRSMVEVGETTGRLDESLTQLAVYLDKQAQLRAKIFSGLAYPALLVAVAMIVLVFLLIWVVPLFSGLFQDMGESLPWLTQVVIDVAEGVRHHFFLLVTLLGTFVMGIRWMLKNQKSRQAIDGWVLRVPLLGSVIQKAATVRFARTLGFLVRRGVPLLYALGVAGTVTGNKVFEQSIKLATTGVQDGRPLSETLRARQIFPPMVPQMIKVGESTGSIDVMLEKIADLFEQEVDRTVATLTSVLEPFIILVVGCGIALVVVAMYLPIFSIGSVIG